MIISQSLFYLLKNYDCSTSEKPNCEPNKFEDFGSESNSSATQKDKDEGPSTLVEPESDDINSFYSSLFFSEVDFYPDSDLEEIDLEKPKERVVNPNQSL